jgi:hypothetical protein
MKYPIVKCACFVAVLVITLFSCQKKVEVVEVPVERGTDTDTTAPAITGFTPDVSWYGNTVTISGTGFSKSASKVWIGATPAEVIAASETSLKIKIAPFTVNGYVHVIVNGKQAISSKELVINKLAWKKQIGGSAADGATCVIPISGGYMVTGITRSTDGDIKQGKGGFDMWVAQLDSNRNIKWQQTLGGSSSDIPVSIVSASDNSYIVTGHSISIDGDFAGGYGGADIWAIKLNKDGAIVWKKVLGGTGEDWATASVPTQDGGCVIAGYTTSFDKDVTGSHGANDIWVVKLNANGGIVWQKPLGGSGNERANSIIATSDGGYVIAGNTNSLNGDVKGIHALSIDMWVVKLNANGSLAWQKPLGGTADETGTSVAATADGGYVIAGSTISTDGDVNTANRGGYDIWIVKLNSVGTLSWQKTLGGSLNEEAISILPTTNGGYILAANTASNDGDIGSNHGSTDIWIATLDADLVVTDKRSLGGSTVELVHFMSATPDNGYLIAAEALSTDGDLQDNHGSYDMWLCKFWP